MPEPLNHIETIHALSIKKLENPPFYTPCEKEIIAYSIAWEGSIQLEKEEDKGYMANFRYKPRISLLNTEYDLLENFYKIVKLGKIGKEKPPTSERSKPSKTWQINTMQECLFLSNEIHRFIPSKRKKRIAELLIKFLVERIGQVREAIEQKSRTVEPYTQNAHDIYELIKKLNRKGR